MGYETSIISIETSEIYFDNQQIIYLESEFDDKTNQQIRQFYREINTEIRLAGFEFVYLPKVAEHFASIAESDLLTIAEFLYPKVSEERMRIVIAQLRELSTSSFCRDQMSNKLSVREFAHVSPSFLIKIGESLVNDKRMSNFLLIGTGENPLTTIRNILGLYAEDYHNMRLNYIQEEKGRFVYTGYYKMLFDVLVLRKGIRSSVVIDPIRECIYFPEADAQLGNIHRREKALYGLFLMEIPGGGINFSMPTSHQQLERYEVRMKSIMIKYRKIYHMFGGEEVNAPDITRQEIRLPMISLIKKQLSELKDILYHVEDYMIQRNSFGNYVVGIPASLCFCCGVEETEIKLLSDSDEWRKISAI